MRLSAEQIEATKLEPEHYFDVRADAWHTGLPTGFPRGFTLIELVMIMVIVGVIAAVAVPRFFEVDVFKSRGFADQVRASLRYAQKVAIAQHGFVCATFTANSVTLTTGTNAACGTALQSPTGDPGYVITAPSGITFGTTPTNFSFNALGAPSLAQTISVNGASGNIVIEAETGYVHE